MTTVKHMQSLENSTVTVLFKNGDVQMGRLLVLTVQDTSDPRRRKWSTSFMVGKYGAPFKAQAVAEVTGGGTVDKPVKRGTVTRKPRKSGTNITHQTYLAKKAQAKAIHADVPVEALVGGKSKRGGKSTGNLPATKPVVTYTGYAALAKGPVKAVTAVVDRATAKSAVESTLTVKRGWKVVWKGQTATVENSRGRVVLGYVGQIKRVTK